MKRTGISVLLLLALTASALGAWFWFMNAQQTRAARPFSRMRIARKSAAEKPGDEKPGGEKPSPPAAPPAKPVRKPASATQKQSAVRSILGQLDAFRRDDYKAAIAFQSREMRRNFLSPQDFRSMIRQSYPQFAQYKTVTFGAATNQTQAGKTLLEMPITLVGQDGVKVQATYFMALEKGVYRVSGVNGGMQNGPSQNPKTFPVPPAYRGIAPLIT